MKNIIDNQITNNVNLIEQFNDLSQSNNLPNANDKSILIEDCIEHKDNYLKKAGHIQKNLETLAEDIERFQNQKPNFEKLNSSLQNIPQKSFNSESQLAGSSNKI